MAKRNRIGVLFRKVRAEDKHLFDWMLSNYDELVLQLGPGRIIWRPVMRVIADLGLIDDHGKPPTQDTAARTWRRVCRRVVTTRAARQSRQSLLGAGEIAPGVLLADGQTGQPMPETIAALKPRVRLEIRPVRPIGAAPPPEPMPILPTTTSPTASSNHTPFEDADDQIKRVFDAFAASRPPMPKVIP